jgi:PAS domain S-box-containing protein
METTQGLCFRLNLKPGDHLCCLCETDEDRNECSYIFLKEGLQRGEKILLVLEASKEAYLWSDGKESTVDIQAKRASGQLNILTFEELCWHQRGFNLELAVSGLQAECERAISLGYSAIRIMIDFSKVWRWKNGPERLFEFESILTSKILGDQCIVICMYDRQQVDSTLLLNMIAHHSIIVAGKEVYHNPSHLPLDDLKQNPAEAILQYRLNNVPAHKTEMGRQALEGHLVDFMEIVREAIITIDEDWKILFFNQGAERTFGYPAQEVLGQSVDMLLPEHLVELHRQHMQKFAASAEMHRQMDDRREISARRKDGSEFPAEASISKLSHDDETLFAVILRDITRRKQIQHSLMESEERFRQLAENIQQIFWICDKTLTEIYYISPAYEQVWGRTCQSLYENPRSFIEHIYPQEKQSQLLEYFRDMEASFDLQFQIKRPDGSLRWIRDRGFPIHNSEGKVYRIAGVAEDITERMQSEEAIRIQAQIIDQIHDAVVSTDLNGIVTSWNSGAQRMFGYSPDEAIGQHISFVYPKELHKFLQDEVITPLRQKFEHQIEVRMLRKSGQEFFAHLSLSVLRDASGDVTGMIGYSMDITSQVRTKQRLRQLSQKIVSAQEEERQRISRELHDEAGQALSALKIGLELIQSDLIDQPAPLHQSLNEAMDLIDKTTEQIRLLAYQLRPPELDALGLSPVLEELCHTYSENTHIVVQYHGVDLPELSDSLAICAYRVVQEALTNVLKHAQAKHVDVILNYDAENIYINVNDDGLGFDKVAVDSSTDRRSGLGLLGMQERVQLLGGSLELKSEPGQGTRISVKLPGEKLE